jgi:hypothetical protein
MFVAPPNASDTVALYLPAVQGVHDMERSVTSIAGCTTVGLV